MTPITIKNEHHKFTLWTLLLLYAGGRILQLFGGQIPSVLVVILHVIPPALFAVIHGELIYQLRGILSSQLYASV